MSLLTANPQPSPLLTASRELLFVGFEKNFDKNVLNFPHHDERFAVEMVDQPFRALRWLESRVEKVETFQFPYAVVFHLDFLRKDGFEIVRRMARNEDLRFVPVIALTEKEEQIDQKELIENGIDDCYMMPVEWSMLENRLEFLGAFKPRLMRNQPILAVNKDFDLKIPVWKRALDIVGAGTALVLASPILAFVAAAIAIESRGGKIFYSQKRAGRGYQVFDFWKFRSMYPDADQRLAELMKMNQYGDGKFFKIENDPRITKIGKIIRKYSIDELPQLWNILRGDMSLVGNRPLPLYEAEALTNDEWAERFMAPAGLTGLWQVTKRGQKNMSDEERIALDIAYSREFSGWMDAKILVKTLSAFKQDQNV